MGGAERAARKRRQQQYAARSTGTARAQATAGAEGKRNVIVGIGVAAVIIALVIGGILWTRADKNATDGETIPAASTAEVPESRDGVVVVTGSSDAPVSIDVYADFLCPACKTFEEQWGHVIAEHVTSGELQARFHMVPMLTERSNPPGYSLHSANAALCAADEGAFLPFHDSLFAAQPEQGKRGWDTEQLIQLGNDLGITGEGFATCVESGNYERQLTDEFTQTAQDPALLQDFGGGPGFGTPTVVGPDGIVEWSDSDWFDSVMRHAQG